MSASGRRKVLDGAPSCAGGGGPAFEVDISIKRRSETVASLNIHGGKSLSALMVALVALWRGNDFGVALKGLIAWFGK